MSHTAFWILFLVKMVFLAGAMLCVFLNWKVLKRQQISRARKRSRLISLRAVRHSRKYMAYFNLLFAGTAVCQLIAPHSVFDSIFWGILAFFWLALAALSMNMVETAIWMRRKFFRPDSASTLRLG